MDAQRAVAWRSGGPNVGVFTERQPGGRNGEHQVASETPTAPLPSEWRSVQTFVNQHHSAERVTTTNRSFDPRHPFGRQTQVGTRD